MSWLLFTIRNFSGRIHESFPGMYALPDGLGCASIFKRNQLRAQGGSYPPPPGELWNFYNYLFFIDFRTSISVNPNLILFFFHDFIGEIPAISVPKTAEALPNQMVAPHPPPSLSPSLHWLRPPLGQAYAIFRISL